MKTQKLENLYSELIEEMLPKYGDTHGLFTLHQGKKIGQLPKQILLLGRENRGHGNFLKDSDGFKIETNDLGWLKDQYKFTKSPFWRVIGKSLRDAYSLDYTADMFENLYWTNLYKISPKGKKANTKSSREKQKPLSKKILREEIILTKPDVVVAFTGEWINAFKETFGVDFKQNNSEMNRYQCNIADHEFVLLALPHPQGKTELPIIKFITESL